MLVEDRCQLFERAGDALREPYPSLATHGFFNFAQSLRASAISRSRTGSCAITGARSQSSMAARNDDSEDIGPPAA